MANTADLTTDADEILALLLPNSREITEAPAVEFEVHDTVRYIGRHQRWIVVSVDGDYLRLNMSRKVSYRETVSRFVSVHRDRVELVCKGNEVDDFIDAVLRGDA